uniref:Uncharacterized protein n=1 Tax=Anguilla anguilla TaxID=7936 RepID=A0A0E9RT28_ANGAN
MFIILMIIVVMVVFFPFFNCIHVCFHSCKEEFYDANFLQVTVTMQKKCF